MHDIPDDLRAAIAAEQSDTGPLSVQEFVDLTELKLAQQSRGRLGMLNTARVEHLEKRLAQYGRMKPNHTADEVVTIEGPQTHSLDIDRVRSAIADSIARVGTTYVTFHFVHARKHRTHSDDFKPSDNWPKILNELFEGVQAVYRVDIQPSDRLGKAKGNPSHSGIQHKTFHDGGGVLHRIPFRGNFLSAWFDSSGNLLDVEGHTPLRRAIRVGDDARAEAQRIGRAYFPASGGEPKGNPGKVRFKLAISRDINGNRILRIHSHEGGFSIQTNGNLPETHRKGVGDWTVNEIADYVGAYGTPRQKELAFQLGLVDSRFPLENPRNPRRPTRMGVVLGNAIRGES